MKSLPKNWDLLKIKNAVCKISVSNIKLKQKEYLDLGKLPVIDQGQSLVGGYTNNKKLHVKCELPVIIFGDHTKVIKYIDFPFVAGADGIKILKPIKAFEPKLFFYFLKAIPLPDKGYARHFQFFEKSFIPLPPLPEQKRIVAKIEELFTDLDAGVEALKKTKALIKKYRQSVLKSAFEGRLTEEWRKANKDKLEPASILLKQIKEEKKKKLGKKYKELLPIDTSNLPELPRGWMWTRLNEISEIILGQSPPSTTYNQNGIGLPFYQGKLEFGDIYPSPQKWCLVPKKLAEKGDVLISVRAPVGPTNICPEKSCIGRGLAGIRPLGGIETFFILYLMRAFENNIAGKGTGTTFNAITGDQLKEFQTPLPPLHEQQKIVEEIEARFSIADSVEKIIENGLKQSERLRQSILKKAFEGKLVPQDPSDEPAEKFLERIKAEKTKLESEKIKKKKVFKR